WLSTPKKEKNLRKQTQKILFTLNQESFSNCFKMSLDLNSLNKCYSCKADFDSHQVLKTLIRLKDIESANKTAQIEKLQKQITLQQNSGLLSQFWKTLGY
ncbi:MAG: hypothetical protein K1060chlam1_01299, partial [Candidatus Anoxychlamydiales bacterium]|nr:hypothetical protein [Candidatus Anoxychlamydiales bacterium]